MYVCTGWRRHEGDMVNPCEAPVLVGLGTRERKGSGSQETEQGVQETAPLRGLCSSSPVRDAMGPSPELSWGMLGCLGMSMCSLQAHLLRGEESGGSHTGLPQKDHSYL